MSSAALKLLNEAKNRMRECEVCTPYQVPAPLWELSQPIIRDLLAMIKAYGFPYSNAGNRHQRLYLKTRHNRVIPLSVSVPPATTALVVGDSSEDCFFIIFKISDESFGIIIWNKKIKVADLLDAMLDLDNLMQTRGFYNPRMNKRTTLFNEPRGFRVSETFPNKSDTYELRDTWDEERVKLRFDEPHKLAIVVLGDKRHLCLAAKANDPNLGQKLKLCGSAPKSPQELLDRIVAQHDATSRS